MFALGAGAGSGAPGQREEVLCGVDHAHAIHLLGHHDDAVLVRWHVDIRSPALTGRDQPARRLAIRAGQSGSWGTWASGWTAAARLTAAQQAAVW